MTDFAPTPEPPYYSVIFTSTLTPDKSGYEDMAKEMIALASLQPGFLGSESAREEIGITVSYWDSIESIKLWKQNALHIHAQELGKSKWYQQYQVRIARVEHDYLFQMMD